MNWISQVYLHDKAQSNSEIPFCQKNVLGSRDQKSLSLNTCIKLKYAEPKLLFSMLLSPYISGLLSGLLFIVISCILKQHSNTNWSLNCSNSSVDSVYNIVMFLYQIIHRRPSSSGSLPPGCRRWVSRRWGRNGGRCRCLRVSQAEPSAQREETEMTHAHQPKTANDSF